MEKLKCVAVVAQLLLSMVSSAPTEPLIISVNTRRASHMVDPHFISFTINPTDLLQGKPFGMGSNLTLAMLKELSPGYIRLGGPDTNKYVFRSKSNAADLPHKSDEIIITEDHWKKINDFLKRAEMEVIACVSSGQRGGLHNKWDPRNTLDLVTYSDSMQYNITWQIGYEPIKEDGISGTQLGKDITQLRTILNGFPRFQQTKIIGPDVKVLHRKEQVEKVLDLLIETGPAINAVTWHPRWPHASAITPSDSSSDVYDFPPDYLEWDRKQLHKLLQRTLLKKPFWIGEPKGEHTGSFAEGLIYARRLINAAKLGIEVVMKDPILKDIAHPKAEYWVAVMHKKMMGRTILDTWSLANHSDVSLAVHCTNRAYGHEQDGGVSVLAVNTHHTEQRAVLRGFLPGLLGEQVHYYSLTAGNEPQSIFSQMTYLNGEPLMIRDDGKMPDILPKNRRFGQNLVVKMPPYSIGFWVVPKAQVPACQVEPFTFPMLDLEDVTTADVLKSAQKGMNSIRNMNEFLVSKILRPLENDMQEKDSREGEEPRKVRQTMTVSSLAQELKDRMDVVKKLININMNGLGRAAKRTDSEEVEFRTTGNKIEKLADDLHNVINSENQEEEFRKFLELSGLKNNFGKLMMEERQARLETGEDARERRGKRDTAFNILKKYPLVADSGKELEHLEKYYKKLMEKYHKTTKMGDKKVPFNFKKTNRDLQEDLLLKEITVLEKTEETLSEMMKSHMERYEAIEEMMKDELEQMKDEKIAMLLEIKTKSDSEAKDGPVPHPNSFDFLESFLKEQEKITKKRETEKEGAPPSDDNSKQDPLETFKLFLNKWKEDAGKRGSMQEKFLEFRNKFTSELKKARESLPIKPVSLTKVIKTEKKTEEVELSSSEKRRQDVLKQMSDYIDGFKEGQTTERVTERSSSGRTTRKVDEDEETIKAKKSVASALIGKVFETIFQKAYTESQPDLVESALLPDYGEQEITEVDGKANGQDLPDVAEASTGEESEKFRGLPTNKEEYLPVPESEQLLEAMSIQQPSAAQPSETEVPTVPEAADSSAVAAEGLATATDVASQYATGDSETSRPRSKRETHDSKTTTAPKNDLLSEAHRQTLARNTVVKKVLATTTPKAELLDVTNVAHMAENTLKLVFDHVIPDAYDQAKKEIENLDIPDYIKNLGKIVENLEHIDTILKDVAKAAQTAPTNHVQKVKRNRRDTEEPDSAEEKIEFLPPTDQTDDLLNNPASATERVPENNPEMTASPENPKDSTYESTTDTSKVTEYSETPKILSITEGTFDSLEEDISVQQVLNNSVDDESISTTATPDKPTTSQGPIAIDKSVEEPLVEQLLSNVAEGIIEDEIVQRLEEPSTQKPTVRQMGNVRMKIMKKMRKYDSGEDATSPMLSSERNIMAMIVDNMLKHHEQLSKQGIKREINGFFRPLSQGYARKARHSLPSQTTTDERVTQFLQGLEPGVYVVPSKDMQNVHAEQTSRTESGRNGKVKPNVVTLNIYYDKKSEEGQGNGVSNQGTGVLSGLAPGAPIQKTPAVTWMTAQRNQYPSLSKSHSYSKLPIVAQPTMSATPAPWSALMPKYYPQLQPVPQAQPMYTSVYAEPQTFKTNAPQLVPAPSYSTWRKPAGTVPIQPPVVPQVQAYEPHPAYSAYWQTAAKVTQQAQQQATAQQLAQPQQKTPQQQQHLEVSYSDSWPAERQVQTAENPEPSNSLDAGWYLQKGSEKTKEVKPTQAKQVIEPYWNKTLKEIFQETAADPFWKFLEAPLDVLQSGSEEQSGRNHERKKRSLENVHSIRVRAYDVRPFDFSWATALPESNVNAYAQDNTLDSARDKRSMLDNFVVKESSHVRYPMENDVVLHKVLTRPNARKFSNDVNNLDDSGRMQLMASQLGDYSNTKSVNRYQVDSNQYLGGPSYKRAVPDSMAEEIQISNPSWIGSSQVDTPSPTQLRALQNRYLHNEESLSFPEAAVTSMADSFPFPLKQMYEMFVDFVKKMIASSV